MDRPGRALRKAVLLSSLLMVFFGCESAPRVVISTAGGGEVAVQAEVADTPAKRELGLQYRTELADDRGMLFVFPSATVQGFWMKNTPIPLDMIFIGSDLKIVGIIHQTAPFSTATLSVSAPSQFVLEVKGGICRQKGIETGGSVRFEGVSLGGVRE